MHDLDTIRENLARYERIRAQRIREANQDRRAGRPNRYRRPRARPTEQTKHRLRNRTWEHYRSVALADPRTGALQRRRLAAGFTLEELATVAGLPSRALVHTAERHPERLRRPDVWRDLASALDCQPEDIRP